MAETEMEQQELSLEKAFEQLDHMLGQLENRELPLEESFRLYKEGMDLLCKCREKIDTVEKKVQIMNGDGGLDEF